LRVVGDEWMSETLSPAARQHVVARRRARDDCAPFGGRSWKRQRDAPHRDGTRVAPLAIRD